MSVTVFGPVIVMPVVETFETFKALDDVVSDAVHSNVEVAVKAGLNPVMVTVLGEPEVKVASP